MNDKMENAVRSVLKLDPDFDPVKADAAIDVLKGRSLAGVRQVDKLDRVLKRKEVARDFLHCDVHHVDLLVRQGHLRRIPPNAKRALGISMRSVKEYQEAELDRQRRALK